MEEETIKDQLEFEDSLGYGHIVEVRWTNCGHRWVGEGEIKRINAATVRVILTKEVGDYPVGSEIIVPLAKAQSRHRRFSFNNCVRPPLWAGGIKRTC